MDGSGPPSEALGFSEDKRHDGVASSVEQSRQMKSARGVEPAEALTSGSGVSGQHEDRTKTQAFIPKVEADPVDDRNTSLGLSGVDQNPVEVIDGVKLTSATGEMSDAVQGSQLGSFTEEANPRKDEREVNSALQSRLSPSKYSMNCWTGSTNTRMISQKQNTIKCTTSSDRGCDVIRDL